MGDKEIKLVANNRTYFYSNDLINTLDAKYHIVEMV